MVADALVYHPAVAHYLRYVATTAGRDKLLRTLQYLSRFLTFYLLRTNATASTISPFQAIKSHFGLTRKLLRIGKNIEHFQAAALAADSKTLDPILRYCAVGRQLSYGVYLSLDAVTYLDAAGIRPTGSAKRIAREAYRAWAVGLMFSLVGGGYTLWKLGEREARLDRKEGEGLVEGRRIERERGVAQVQVLSDVCDLIVPSSALGWVGLDDGLVGLAGTVSSLIGVRAVWRKTA